MKDKSTIAWSNRQYTAEMLFDSDIVDGRDETVVGRPVPGPNRLHVKEEKKRSGREVFIHPRSGDAGSTGTTSCCSTTNSSSHLLAT